MFFKQPDLIFDIKKAELSNTPTYFLPIEKNLKQKIPHEMLLEVKGTDVRMTLDNLPQSVSDFKLNSADKGYISLVSNTSSLSEGAFLYLYIFRNNEKIFEINFKDIKYAEELEQWFDCYYFKILDGRHGRKCPISEFWHIYDGRLRCINEERSEGDITEYCLLTYKLRRFGDFDAVLGFEQCGYRYGLSFGSPIAEFPFYREPHTMTIKVANGGFAYAEQEGYRNLRGNISRDDCADKEYYVHAYKTPLPSFYSKDDHLTFSFSDHALLFHIKSDAVYKFNSKIINVKSGSISYIPPNLPFERNYTTDKYIAVFFRLINNKSFEPDNLMPADKSEYEFQFDRILKTFDMQNDTSYYECMYILYKIYAMLLKEKQNNYHIINTEQAVNYPKILRPALEYLDSHFTDPNLRIPQLAKMCNLSETYFREQFTRQIGVSPQSYIQKKRIDFSIFLLDSDYYKIYEVAEKSGFSNSKYFSTVFKRFMKLSPTEWLENRNKNIK